MPNDSTYMKLQNMQIMVYGDRKYISGSWGKEY